MDTKRSQLLTKGIEAARRNGLVRVGLHRGHREFADSQSKAIGLAHALSSKYNVQVDVGLMLDGKEELYGVFRRGQPYKEIR